MKRFIGKLWVNDPRDRDTSKYPRVRPSDITPSPLDQKRDLLKYWYFIPIIIAALVFSFFAWRFFIRLNCHCK
jgi:hypothetical protein